MYCQHCGTKFDETDRFCGTCGTARAQGAEGVATRDGAQVTLDYQGVAAGSQGRSPGRRWTIGAFACAAIAVFAIPILFAAIGVVLGWQGKKKGDTLGQAAIWAAIGGGVLGFIVNLMLMT